MAFLVHDLIYRVILLAETFLFVGCLEKMMVGGTYHLYPR